MTLKFSVGIIALSKVTIKINHQFQHKCPYAVLLNASLLYDRGRLSDLFVRTGRFLVAFMCKSFFCENSENKKGEPLDNITTTFKNIQS